MADGFRPGDLRGLIGCDRIGEDQWGYFTYLMEYIDVITLLIFNLY